MRYLILILVLCVTAQASPTAVRADGYTCNHSLGTYDGDFCVHYATPVPWEGLIYYHPCFHMVGYRIQVTCHEQPFKQGGLCFVGSVDSQGTSPTEPTYGSQPVHVINAITRSGGDGTVKVKTSSQGKAGIGYVMGAVGGPALCLPGGISVRVKGNISSGILLDFPSTKVEMDFIEQPCILRGLCTGGFHDDNMNATSDCVTMADPNRYAPWTYPLPDGFTTGWLQLLQRDDGAWYYEVANELDTASLPTELIDLNDALEMVGPYVYVVRDPLQGRFPQDAAIVLDGVSVHCRLKDGVYMSDYVLPVDSSSRADLFDRHGNIIHCIPVPENSSIAESFCDPNAMDVPPHWLETNSISDVDGSGRVDFVDWAILLGR